MFGLFFGSQPSIHFVLFYFQVTFGFGTYVARFRWAPWQASLRLALIADHRIRKGSHHDMTELSRHFCNSTTTRLPKSPRRRHFWASVHDTTINPRRIRHAFLTAWSRGESGWLKRWPMGLKPPVPKKERKARVDNKILQETEESHSAFTDTVISICVTCNTKPIWYQTSVFNIRIRV